MTEITYQYAMELTNARGTCLGQASVQVDFEPAGESARFDAIRRGDLSPGHPAPLAVEPLWVEQAGPPHLQGFRVRVGLPPSAPRQAQGRPGAGKASYSEFSTVYFADLARQESYRMVDQGRLAAGERFTYRVTAFPTETALSLPKGRRFHVQHAPRDLSLRHGTLGDFLSQAEPRQTHTAGDMPVFLPQHVLDEAVQQAQASPEHETGGILVGHLRHDPEAREVFAEVTAYIPAVGAEAGPTSLRFTPETWTHVRSVLRLRGREESFLGWSHAHLMDVLCPKCPLESRRVCPLAVGFFSPSDRALHRTVFPGAHQSALVVNLLDRNHATYSFFGWRKGRLETRGFHVLGARKEGGTHGNPS